MRFIVLLFSLVLTQQLEVEGDLKVTGNIDASNQRIKNVAPPTMTTDAVNAEYLNSVMTDDGVYEYMFIYLKFQNAAYNQDNVGHNIYYLIPPESVWQQGAIEVLNSYSQQGWQIVHRAVSGTNQENMFSVYELRRKLEE